MNRTRHLFLALIPAFLFTTAIGNCAHIVLTQNPPNLIIEEDRYARLDITAVADQPTVGPLFVTLSITGPATLSPAFLVLNFGTKDPQTGPEPTLTAADSAYITPTGSTGIITVTASAYRYSPAKTVMGVHYKDSDSDGIPDFKDLCPNEYDPRQYDADADGKGDACDSETDVDKDGIHDTKDNCPTIANADQLDSDRDGYGDACDNFPRDRKKD